MRTWLLLPLAAALALGLWTGAAEAGVGSNNDAMLALHIAPVPAKGTACAVSFRTDCREYSTFAPAAGSYDIYLMVANGNQELGVSGIQYGIDYDGAVGAGVDVDGWATCADLEFPTADWLSANSGNLMTWIATINCKNSVLPFMAGAFRVTVYSPDVFSIIPRPVDGWAKVADCGFAESDITNSEPSRLGVVSFGMEGAYNPCVSMLVSAERTTWGAIKSLYD